MSGEPKKFRNAESPYDYHTKSEQLVREYQISLESMALVRQRLADCARTEAVNQFVNCKELREKYAALCKDNYRGMVMPPDFEPTSREIPGLTK